MTEHTAEVRGLERGRIHQRQESNLHSKEEWRLVRDVITRLQELGAVSVRELDGISENVVFPIPKALT